MENQAKMLGLQVAASETPQLCSPHLRGRAIASVYLYKHALNLRNVSPNLDVQPLYRICIQFNGSREWDLQIHRILPVVPFLVPANRMLAKKQPASSIAIPACLRVLLRAVCVCLTCQLTGWVPDAEVKPLSVHFTCFRSPAPATTSRCDPWLFLRRRPTPWLASFLHS